MPGGGKRFARVGGGIGSTGEKLVSSVDWTKRWEEGRIGFHEGQANAHLVAHFSQLSVPKGGRVFVPLCGKTMDIHWLLGGGYRVAGVELSELAISQLFAELEVTPNVADLGALKRYSAEGIDIYVGDIFDLDAGQLGAVDAVFDRAALVALPEDVRGRYANHVMRITSAARQLLVTFEYDQAEMNGPPFSISEEEVRQRFSGRYTVGQLGDGEASLRGIRAREVAWLLK